MQNGVQPFWKLQKDYVTSKSDAPHWTGHQSVKLAGETPTEFDSLIRHQSLEEVVRTTDEPPATEVGMGSYH